MPVDFANFCTLSVILFLKKSETSLELGLKFKEKHNFFFLFNITTQ